MHALLGAFVGATMVSHPMCSLTVSMVFLAYEFAEYIRKRDTVDIDILTFAVPMTAIYVFTLAKNLI